MASSSLTSSIPKSFKYDVFISFRGEDTHKNFVAHLYDALKQKAIETYMDNEKIEKGEKINDELIRSIEDSRFFIVVFSKNYASSAWCLDELVKIMECNKMTEHIVIPVYYDVEPSEVRKQSGAFGKAFSKHTNKEGAGKWREALKEASNLTGWDLKATANGDESKLIQDIVDGIFQQLCSNNHSDDGYLVGMENRIKDVESLLETGLDNVRMIGIKGMGGAGKTTLARAVFDKLVFHFEGASFVENVRDVSGPSLSGLKKLQKQILSDVLTKEGITLSSVNEGMQMMKRMMRGRKILLVLDDVDQVDQLEALAGELDWFKPGSRIIITTRDAQLLRANMVKWIYDVKLLSDEESLCLFSRHAFRRDLPIEGYKELSLQVVQYAAGLPLTLKVLGSYLCDHDKLQWIDALERLKDIPLKETLKKLELSYTRLEDDYKEIFLDVACLLKGWDKERASRMLESCGFPARNGLRVLEQKSMIITTKTSQAEFIDMHPHIEEMGKYIVRRVNPNMPSRHSRLWIQEEIEDILANKLATKATTQAIAVGKLSSEIVTKGFGSFQNLTSLCLKSEIDDDCVLKNDEIGMIFPNALKFLSWVGYPHWSLPKTFQATNLVGLEMPYSRIKRLWEEGEEKVLYKLRYIDLNHSRLRTLDLRLTQNLETLNLSECHDLVELQLPIECLKLWSLKISHSKLKALHLGLIPNLKMLELKECHGLVEPYMSIECPKLTSLELSCSKMKILDLGLTPNLEMLYLVECHDLVDLYMPIECLKLRSVNLSHSKLKTLYLGRTPNLEMLDLVECHDLVQLQLPIKCMKLWSLKISHSKLKTLNLGLIPNLKVLKLKECHDLVELHMPNECPKLTSLELSYSKMKTLDLGLTPNLEMLYLVKCHDLVELHIPIECPKLTSLELSCSKLKTLHLVLTPNLEMLDLAECHDLVELQLPIKCIKLWSLKISNSKLKTLNLGLIPNLKVLKLKECHDLVELHLPNECPKLTSLELICSKLKTLHLGLTPNLEMLDLVECHDLVDLYMPIVCPKLNSLELSCSKLSTFDLRLTPNLEMLRLEECHDLVELHMPIECLKIRSLNLSHSKLKTLDLGLTPNLEMLDLQDCYHLEELHTPFACLKRLVFLNLSGCSKIKSFLFIKQLESLEVLSLTRLYMKEFPDMIIPRHLDNSLLEFRFRYNDIYELPSSIENLQQLVYLDLHSCRKLKVLPGSICSLRNLRNLKLYGCSLEELPEDIGRLECLQKLNMSFTSIKHLPDSICRLKNLNTLNLSSCWNLEKLPEDIGRLECLQKLILTECTLLRDVPESICMLKELKYLSFLDCIQLQKLPEKLGDLRRLEELNIKGTRIRFLPPSISVLTELKICGPQSGIRGIKSTLQTL